MKLWYSTTSPYARLVRAVAAHHGLASQIQLHKVTHAFSADSPHNQDTPLGRIPVMQCEDGLWLLSSRLIAEYLDAMGAQDKLFVDGAMRWQVLNLYALAEGLLENSIVMLAEKMNRPQNEWWHGRHAQIQARNRQTLIVLAEQCAPFADALNIGTLFAACAVDFLLFREELIGAREDIVALRLDRWVEEMNRRYPCLDDTRPFVSR